MLTNSDSKKTVLMSLKQLQLKKVPMYVIITSMENKASAGAYQLIPLNFATLKEYVVLQIIMSLTMTDDSTPDRGGDVVS